jgi:hypothetical protein
MIRDIRLLIGDGGFQRLEIGRLFIQVVVGCDVLAIRGRCGSCGLSRLVVRQ